MKSKTYECANANVCFEKFLASYQITKYIMCVRNYVDIHYDLTLEVILTNILGSTNSGSNKNKPKFSENSENLDDILPLMPPKRALSQNRGSQ
jgi:hypothetical protein